ncbi:hypothetical protein A5661_24980 [Mycobacterium asiaticum]|nr:hypothetical protein A5661_24980 [Mycobacterium asiaticum]
MDLRERWSVLDRLCRCAERFPRIEIWAFGSALDSHEPHDLDVLVVYADRADVVALRDMDLWEVNVPPIDLIAMTVDEVDHYRFIELTGALRVHPLIQVGDGGKPPGRSARDVPKHGPTTSLQTDSS